MTAFVERKWQYITSKKNYAYINYMRVQLRINTKTLGRQLQVLCIYHKNQTTCHHRLIQSANVPENACRV